MEFSCGVNAYDHGFDAAGEKVHVPVVTASCTWHEFGDLLRDVCAVHRHPSTKILSPWISAAIFDPTTGRRRMQDIQYLSNWIGVDLDEPGWCEAQIAVQLDGVAWLAHTTTKSRATHQRWRVLILLDRPYSVEEQRRLWRAFNSLFHDQLDPSTKNANRILHVPAQWEGADNVFCHHDGEPAPVDGLLAMAPPDPPPVVPPQPTDYHVEMVTAPDGTPIIPERALDKALSEPAGGRLWRLMCGAAVRFQANGWTLSADDLMHAARAAGRALNPKLRPNLGREATRAIEWAAGHIMPLTPMQKVRQRLAWEKQRHEKLLRGE